MTDDLTPRLPWDDGEPFVQVRRPRDPRRGTARERFERFHAENPQVYRKLRELARYVRRRGARRFGMKALFEQVRWSYFVTTGDLYKLNNNYTAYYARLLMDSELELRGLFATRASPHDPEYATRTPRPARAPPVRAAS